MTDELDGLFLDADPTRRVRGALAPVLVVAGSKGGVGATTVAIVAAEMARISGGVERVVIVDADPQSSHVASYLRARTTGADAVPTILTGALRQDYRHALASPDRVNATHGTGVPDVSVFAVLAPPVSQYDPVTVTSYSYMQTLQIMRRTADLVIMDTGTLLAQSPTSLQESFVYPALRTGAWLLLVASTSRPAVQSALETTRSLTGSGTVSKERTFSLINARRAVMDNSRVDRITNRMAQFSTPLGVVDYDEENVGDLLEAGHIPSGYTPLVAPLAEALHVITGRPSFAEVASGRRKPGDRPGAPLRKRLAIPGLSR